ncbi:YLP motif-containing protein 1-like isoform X2 [Maniola hyperantus]|uniref:YLP motif-containing protein 1-like isoform X2 n=1 Tax=Aphantopus hyperantus TaxID=2795564 RepID=UPI00374972C7
MAWSMPTSGQWNPGIGMTPDMSSMGSYTPEQWALMQQQNWQQWSQWQQQYAQWQNQYGGEYAQQMQGMQAMAGVPPAPSGAVPPPVPPPDKPPPPPPHENDQPLYGSAAKASSTASSVKPHQNTQLGYNNGNTTTGNNQNWSYTADPQIEKPSTQGVNTEALRMLAEEEKQFDIQFQKWEEEIEKWKKENVNHPDRQAYSEYEQKFEACRAQLLERRQQMKIKRDKLMGNAHPASNTTKTGNNNKNATPPTQLKTNVSNYTPNMQTNIPPNVQNQKTNVQNYSNKNQSQYQQYTKPTHQGYNRNNNKTVDPQDRYDSYQDFDADYRSAPPVNSSAFPTNKKDIRDAEYRSAPPVNSSAFPTSVKDNIPDAEYRSAPPVNSSFLPTSKSSKDIPGLDLVPEIDKSNKHDIIDITDDMQSQQQSSAAPDYSKISKGINNILGDEKIMNILSMVTNQKPPNTNEPNQSGPYQQGGNVMQSHQWEANNTNYYNNNYNNQQQNVPFRQQNMNNFQNPQGQGRNSKFPDQAFQRYDRNYDDNYADNANMRHNDVQQGQYNRQNQFGNQNMPQRGAPPPFRSDMPPPRPLLANYPPPQNPNDYPQGGFERKDIQPKPMIQPVMPKWVEEPLFTPSIIVEYDHKPLRLKARDFIEPVHMFDYNHKSKDGDNDSKRDFEKEVDELFSRKPRNVDRDDWSSERLYSRDYDRASARDDFKERSNRGDNEFYDRRDDRDRFKRQDYDRWGDGSDRLRDTGYGRDRPLDRDLGRERDMGRDFGRDMDLSRERDFRRDREPGRDRDLGRDREMGRDRDAGRGRDFARDRDVDRERDYGRDRNSGRDPIRDRQDKRDMSRNRSRSRDKDSRKRGHSRGNDSNDSFGSKKTKDSKEDPASWQKPSHIVMIDDLLESPGRDIRPAKIVIILRGPPGSGKSYLAKLIRDKEAEHGVTVRIMSIDDYFMQESEIEEKDPNTGKIVKKPSLKYEYDEKLEENYMNSLKRAFKRSLTDGYFTFLIYDAINDQLKNYADIWNFSRQCGFQVYICTMEMDAQSCLKRNIHNRSLEEIEVILSRFFPTPAHHIQLDATTLLQNAGITDVTMEDADDVTMEDADVVEVDSSFTSKWEKMDDAAQLARLDGTSKPLRPSQLSMEDYLQLDDWKPSVAKPGKKTVF